MKYLMFTHHLSALLNVIFIYLYCHKSRILRKNIIVKREYMWITLDQIRVFEHRGNYSMLKSSWKNTKIKDNILNVFILIQLEYQEE